MTDTEKYNGWTNRETWAVSLHINNSESFQAHTRWAAHTAKGAPYPELTLADTLKDWIEGLSEDVYAPGPAGEPDRELCAMFGDIGSLWRVNWREIAANLLEDS